MYSPTPQANLLFVQQASYLLATEVQALSSIAVYLKSQFSSIARLVTNSLRTSVIPGGGSGGVGELGEGERGRIGRGGELGELEELGELGELGE